MSFEENEEFEPEIEDDEEWKVSAGTFELVGLEISNFGPIRSAFVPLESDVTVLYGLNGAGKSNVMGALSSVLKSELISDRVTAPSNSGPFASPSVKVWLQADDLRLAIDDSEDAWDPLRAIWFDFERTLEEMASTMGYENPLESLKLDAFNYYFSALMEAIGSENEDSDSKSDNEKVRAESYRMIPELWVFITTLLLVLDESNLIEHGGTFIDNDSQLFVPILDSIMNGRVTYEVSQHSRRVGLCLSPDGEAANELVAEVKETLYKILWPGIPEEEIRRVLVDYVLSDTSHTYFSEQSGDFSENHVEQAELVLALHRDALSKYEKNGHEAITEELDSHFPFFLCLTDMRQVLESVLAVQKTPVWALDVFVEGDGDPGRLPIVVVNEESESFTYNTLIGYQSVLEERRDEDSTFYVPSRLLAKSYALRRGPSSRTTGQARDLVPELFATITETSLEIDPELDRIAGDLQESANSIFERLIKESPKLSCRVTSPLNWSSDGLLTWQAQDSSGSWVTLDQLSSAEERWAHFSIKLADALLAKKESDRVVILIDEPERALHRRAERNLAQALKTLAEETPAKVVIASHSPAFLSRRDFSLLHVHRDGRKNTRVNTLSGDLRARAEELGLEPAELLQMCRAILLVEGEHEKVILRELIGSDLDELSVEVLCMRGARALKSWDAQLIQRFTDVPFLILTDNDESKRISDIWFRARDARENSKPTFSIINELKEGARGSEGEFLRELCLMLVEEAQYGRFGLYSLEKPDITEYLPLGQLSSKAVGKSWDDLRREAASKANQSTAFKKWATDNYGVDYSSESLHSAASSMDQIPVEFVALLSEIDGLLKAYRLPQPIEMES